MNESKHTDGAWTIRPPQHGARNGDHLILGRNDELIAVVVDYASPVEVAANAALLAAAPALLVAVKVFVAMIEDSMRDMIHPAIGRFVPDVTDLELKPDGSATLCQVRALIAKAEGRS